jgi:hypothetical protein
MIPQLPKWSDPISVSLFLTAAFGAVVCILGMFHVGISPGVTANVTTLSGIAGSVIALAVNAITHRSAHAKVAVITVAQTGAPPPNPVI